MEAYIYEWLNLLLRWAHLITGIAWIGSSFYFVWLDTNLNVPPRDPENDDIRGDLWAVHGGGFYHAQKYKVAPQQLPEPLHWFKWEAYFTWITGFLLLVIVYYVNAEVYLVDKRVADITGNTAILISLGSLLLGWLLYDVLCKTVKDDKLIASIGMVFIILYAWSLSQYFGGRGLYIQTGAVLGSIMVANVFFVIIPGQWELVKAKERGEEPDPIYGLRGKQRSVHNNYLTLPVLFIMLSNHSPMTYSHDYNWLVLIVIFIVGVIIRHYFNLRNQGKNVISLPILAVIILMILAFAITPVTRSVAMDNEMQINPAVNSITFTDVQMVIESRCVVCHSENPNHPTAPVAPLGVMLDNEDQINNWAGQIHDRTVVQRTMPLANLTNMTEEERHILDKWYTERLNN